MNEIVIQKITIFIEQGIHLLIFLVAILYGHYDKKIPVRISYSVHPSFFLFILGFLVYELVRIRKELHSLTLNEWIFGVLLLILLFIFYLFIAYRNIFKKLSRLEKCKSPENAKGE